MYEIIVTDGHTANPGDLSWKALEDLGNVTIYDATAPDEVIDRCKNAHVIITNKVKITGDMMAQLPELKLISVMATGYDIIDIPGAKKHKITVCNAAAYSTHSVAQQVFAYLLYFTNQINAHNSSVQQGGWTNADHFAYFLNPIEELREKTLGIFGLGKIGQQVAKIGLAFSMNVIAYRQNFSKGSPDGVQLVDSKTIFSESDFLTLHAPLNEDSRQVINKDSLAFLKSTAYLVNTARGGLIDEFALRNALVEKRFAGAAIDVLSTEPPSADNPLIGLDNCIITPHNAWMSVTARKKLMSITVENIRRYAAGKPQNIVV